MLKAADRLASRLVRVHYPTPTTDFSARHQFTAKKVGDGRLASLCSGKKKKSPNSCPAYFIGAYSGACSTRL
jgi:hypothetical protein